MNNEITLDDLLNSDPSSEASTNNETNAGGSKYAPVNPTDIRPATDIKSAQKEAEKEVTGEILEGVGRKLDQLKKNREEMKESLIESMEAEELDDELNEEDSEQNTTSKDESEESLIATDEDIEEVNRDITLTKSTFVDSDLEELEKELEDSISEEPDEFTEDDLKVLSDDIKKYVKPVKNEVDLDSFAVSNSSISGARVISMISSVIEQRNSTYADWVLVDTGKIISMRSFDSDDLDKLQRLAYRTPLNAVTETWNLLYDHCVDENKPDTMEKWLSQISSLDIPHIYACVYKASFQDSSYIPFTCTNKECGKPFIPGATPFDELVKYENAEAKDYVNGIFNGSITSSNSDFNAEHKIQVSDSIAIGIKKPSIYGIIFENLALDEPTKRKFSDALNIISYISNIYYIDRESHTLTPVIYQRFADNRNKTTKSKLLTYSKILKTLNSDQKGLITGKISSVVKDQDKVSYAYPTVTCTHCGHTIESQETDPQTLLFTRHRLTALMT